jgi:GT2 family glycosyltransferase
MNKKLAIVTVIYNHYEVTGDFLKSLANQTNKNFKLFIADLSDKKEDFNQIFGKLNFDIELLISENKGYAHGVNLGLKKVLTQNFDKFCIINNDTYFNQDFVENVLSALKKYPGSIIGGKIYYAPGYEYHKTRYKKKNLGKVIWYAGGLIDWKNVITPHRGVDEVDQGQYDQFEETEFVTGCLICFDKNVINKVGFWDESYFLYFEDADFCVRAARKGIKLFYDPKIIIWHKNAQSTQGSGSLIHQKYLKKNRLKFGLKYAPLRTKLHLVKEIILDLLD